MLVFLDLNRIELEYSQEELYTIILKIASSQATIEKRSSLGQRDSSHVSQDTD